MMPKNKSDNRAVEIKMGDELHMQTNIIISVIKSKLLSTKGNDDGTNQLFQVLGEKQLGNIFNLAEESLNMPVWKYNDKCYLKNKDKQITDYAVDKSKTEGGIEVINFTKDMPYILDLTFYRYELEKSNEVNKGYTIFEINNKLLNYYIYRIGLSESSLTAITKPFSF